MGLPLSGSIWKPELLGCRIPTCRDLPSGVLRKRMSPSAPPAAAAGAAEQPPLAFTQLLRISNLPSVVSAIARTDVQRSIRTRNPISATRAPPAKSKVETTGDGLLSMIKIGRAHV